MSQFPVPPALPIDAEGNVVADIPCRKCGYDLRGLNQMGRCPECGTPVGISVNGDLLRYSDPAWLTRVSKGIALILWGILVGIALGVVSSVISALLSPAAGDFVGLLGGVMGLVGGWMMTEPDPSGIGEEGKLHARQIARVAIVAGFAGQVLQVLTTAMSQAIPVRWLIAALAIPLSILWIVGEFAKLTYIRKLALRIPDFTLAQNAHHIRWGYAITLGIVVMAGALAVVIGASGGSGGAMGIACFAGIAAIGMLVYAILAIVLMFRMRKAIGVQAQLAAELWNQQGSQGSRPAPL